MLSKNTPNVSPLRENKEDTVIEISGVYKLVYFLLQTHGIVATLQEKSARNYIVVSGDRKTVQFTTPNTNRFLLNNF